MDILTETLFAVKESCVDGLIVLPHLLLGFFLFIGVFTTNVGMICLAIGQLLIVPALSFFANSETSFKKDVPAALFSSALPVSILTIVSMLALATSSGLASMGFLPFLAVLYIVKLLFDFYKFRGTDTSVTLFDALNPYVWFSDVPIKVKPEGQNDLCFIAPGASGARQTPSGWMIHVLFFFGFLMANAYTLYVQPSPAMKPSGDSEKDASRLLSLQQRVANRKFITGMVMGVSAVLLLALVYVRTNLTPCENSLAESFVPMILCFFFGIAWYTILTENCGISSSDILGLVQGLISPDAIDNPIVCIGTDPGASK
jgi:hypothetical protein